MRVLDDALRVEAVAHDEARGALSGQFKPQMLLLIVACENVIVVRVARRHRRDERRRLGELAQVDERASLGDRRRVLDARRRRCVAGLGAADRSIALSRCVIASAYPSAFVSGVRVVGNSVHREPNGMPLQNSSDISISEKPSAQYISACLSVVSGRNSFSAAIASR